jgi:uncharacterized protein
VSTFGWISLAAWAGVVALAAIVRGRLYAIFATVLLGIHTSVSVALWPAFEPVWPVYAYLQASVYVHFAALVWARLRPRPYRVFVSLPGSFFLAGTFLAFPWAIAVAFGLSPVGVWIPYLAAAFGLYQSVRHAPEEIDITVDGRTVESLRRHPRGDGRVERPLRLVQITDPHLGPFMSERRLRLLAERAADRDPDLVLLTGDFVTMESHRAEEALIRALAPLRKLEGRVFACLGNHDHEAPRMVARALEATGARLLIDEAVVVETPAGKVDVLGLDFHFRNRKERIAAACDAYPRTDGAFRLVLLHDPGAYKHVPDGHADLVLSGHTHGGQLGLLSLGLPYTIVSALTSIPDHGLWALGSSRLYVHRGTSHYGFPLRIGVPSEESLLRVHHVRDSA